MYTYVCSGISNPASHCTSNSSSNHATRFKQSSNSTISYSIHVSIQIFIVSYTQHLQSHSHKIFPFPATLSIALLSAIPVHNTYIRIVQDRASNMSSIDKKKLSKKHQKTLASALRTTPRITSRSRISRSRIISRSTIG